jgi:hypothetical protein
MNATAADALLKHRIRHGERNDTIDLSILLCKHLVEGLGLRDRSGESVENEFLAALGLRDLIPDDADHDIVGDE